MIYETNPIFFFNILTNWAQDCISFVFQKLKGTSSFKTKQNILSLDIFTIGYFVLKLSDELVRGLGGH